MSNCALCNDRSSSTLACLAKLNNCPNYRAYPRVYIQFNELVFDGIETVNTADLSGDYKISTNPYPFAHGSYYGGSFKRGRLLTGEQDLSLDLNLPFVGLTRLQTLDYNDFIQYNLTQAGKLWAFDTGGKLIWAWAIPKHPPYSDYEIRNGRIIHYQMDFLLPEGFWHVADTNHVFLEPYSMCDMKDSFGTGCAHDCNSLQQCENEQCNLCCDVTPDMGYCNTCWNPYDNCANPYRIIYNCKKAEKFYGWKEWGEIHMPNCDNQTVGTFCSNTIYDAPVQVTIMGKFENPMIRINDIRIRIHGTFNGRLVVNIDGTICYYKGEPCDQLVAPVQVSYDDIEYLDNEIIFTAHRGENVVYVLSDEECPLLNLVWLKVDELTI